jgi:uncharacterized protein YbjT (DUF2867 family)
MRIAVAGGTGLIGTMVVEAADAAGHQVVVLARSRGVDLVHGTGLEQGVLADVGAVIDVTNTITMSVRRSTAFFTAVTENLLTSGERAGVAHHVTLSIVGVDRAPYGYYAGKRSQERSVERGPVPWTIVRATQFHEMAKIAYDAAHLGPLHLAPRMRIQPVAAREVAAHLVDLATGPPADSVVEIAGPRPESLDEMVKAYAKAVGSRSWVPAVSMPGALGRAQRDGTLLPQADVVLAEQSFAEWLQGV